MLNIHIVCFLVVVAVRHVLTYDSFLTSETAKKNKTTKPKYLNPRSNLFVVSKAFEHSADGVAWQLSWTLY